jgi:DNA-binding LacI/PurR family transcriptional regulator
MNATLADVATAAGVSIATASRVFAHSKRVSDDARARVHEAAVRLDYVRHRVAPPRNGIRSAAIVVRTGHQRLFGDAFYPRLIASAGAELAAHQVLLLVVSVTDATLGTVGRYLHGGHVDGLIVVSDHGPDALSASLATYGRPLIVVGRPPTAAAYVDADNRGGARSAVEYLLARGRTRIAHVAGPKDTSAAVDRLAGYRDGMRDAGHTDLPVAYGDWSHASGAHAMERLLDRRPRLDAVFVASDAMAAGAIRALARLGRRVPDDVAVIGFDDHVLAAQLTPALTTVRQPIEEFGTVAARHLIHPGPLATILTTSLVIRESA